MVALWPSRTCSVRSSPPPAPHPFGCGSNLCTQTGTLVKETWTTTSGPSAARSRERNGNCPDRRVHLYLPAAASGERWHDAVVSGDEKALSSLLRVMFKKDTYMHVHIRTSPWAMSPPQWYGPPLPRIICILGMMLAVLGMLSSTV